MTRPEAIQKIVWTLLAHADAPAEAVATAKTVRVPLGSHAEGDFRNLLRAAGLFARDDDGSFVRYTVGKVFEIAHPEWLNVPAATHVLTVPVPVEPRMRIAYGVFTGLLLKYLYQTHGAVPIQVAEGMAMVWIRPPTSLPGPEEVWKSFEASDLAADALRDGIQATLSAVGNIGAIAVTDSLAGGPLLKVLLEVLPSYERKFQAQGGMRLDFFLKEHIEKWQHDLGVSRQNGDTVESVWAHSLQGPHTQTAAKKIAALLLDEELKDATSPLMYRSLLGLWRGEGSGNKRKKGRRDSLGWKPKNGWKDIPTPETAEEIDTGLESALAFLERRRQGTQALDRWLGLKLVANTGSYVELLNVAIATLNSGEKASLDAGPLLDEIAKARPNELLVAFINERQIRTALQETLKNHLAWDLARRTNSSDIAIFGWPATILRTILEEKRYALRFIKKLETPNARKIFEVKPFGAVARLPAQGAAAPAPFSLEPFAQSRGQATASVSLPSKDRCIVCGATADLIGGTKSFLPESKKRWYESPTSFVEPKLCSNCAFVAYLSSIYPSDEKSIAEFPVDNFLELFALHEHLQGVSGIVALKVLNRVATLSVLPSRYLLLSKTTKKGKMDSKTQVYAQLRNHVPLLKDLNRPMRVQVEGAQPNFCSEIHPHVAVGLSYFGGFPGYLQTGGRKLLAQRVTRALIEGRPFMALYVATQEKQPKRGFGWERIVLTHGLRTFESEFVTRNGYARRMAQALGGNAMNPDLYQDVIEFSNYLLDLVRPLVQREVQKGGSAVSGTARKYTELITRDFAEGRAAKFLYAVCKEADSAERDGNGWAKWQSFEKLYGGKPTVEGRSGEEAARLWADFRGQHPKTALETRIEDLQEKHGKDAGLWGKFLAEVQARTLALLMLNVRNVSTR